LKFEGRKILFISLTRTGCVEYAAALAEKIGYDKLYIVCSEESAPAFIEKDVIIKTYSGKWGFMWRSMFFRKGIEKILDKFHAEHGNHFTILFPVFHPWNIMIYRWSQRKKVLLHTVVHDYNMHSGEEDKNVQWFQNKIIDQSAKVIFLTRAEQEKAIQYGVDKQKTIIWPHPLLSVKAQHNCAHSKKLKLLYLGRVKKYKGIELLIEAIAELDIEKLTIAGEGKLNDSYPNTVEHINKRITEEEMAHLIETHHVLVLPYIDASQSGILTIGISANIPMLITKQAGLQEQLNNESAIWCAPSVKGIKSGIEEYQNSPEKYQSIKQNMERFKIKFESENSALYEQCTKS